MAGGVTVLMGRGGGATGRVARGASAAHPGVQILPEVRVGLAGLGLLRRGRGGGSGRCAALAADYWAGDGEEARSRRRGGA